jgi:hypothetical protein
LILASVGAITASEADDFAADRLFGLVKAGPIKVAETISGSKQVRTSKWWLPTKSYMSSRRKRDDSGFMLTMYSPGWRKKES